MSELDRSPARTPRRVREQRAYRLALAGAAFGAVAIFGLALAIFGVMGAGLPIGAGALALLCAFLFWRTVSP